MKRIKLKLTGYQFKLILGLVFNMLTNTDKFLLSTTFAVLYIWVKNKVLPKYAFPGLKENQSYSISLDYAQAIALYDFLINLPKFSDLLIENTIRQIVFQLNKQIVNIKNDFFQFDQPSENQNILKQ